MKLKQLTIMLIGVVIMANKPLSAQFSITSPDFQHEGPMPISYGCPKILGGQNAFPQISWSGIPTNTQSLVLIVDDPDAPAGTWIHWLVYNINPAIAKITQESDIGDALVGKNSWGTYNYGAPCPPSGIHRYYFRLYALDTRLTLPAGSSREDIECAMQNHIIGQTELMGTYSK